jgi:hypothetical protein
MLGPIFKSDNRFGPCPASDKEWPAKGMKKIILKIENTRLMAKRTVYRLTMKK